MKKLLFYLAALPIVSSAIAISAGDYVDIHIDQSNKIIFEGIKD